MNYKDIEPGPDDLDRRLDRVIRKAYPVFSLGEIYRSLRKGGIRVNMKKKKPDYRLCPGDVINLAVNLVNSSGKTCGDLNHSEQPSKIFNAENFVLKETDDLLLINKPAGIEIHGRNSITEGVIHYLEGKIPESLSFRPGPLHRLDRNTSGIVAFGKSLRGAREFSRLLKSDGIEKYYIAILDGKTPDRGKWTDILSREGLVTRIDGNSRGKKGITSFKTLFSTGELSLVLFRLHTGRTHQIRAQAGGHGHSLSGDVKYGGSKVLRHYCLHAWLIKSEENLQPLPAEAPLPAAFSNHLSTFFSKKAQSIMEEEKKKIFSGLEEW